MKKARDRMLKGRGTALPKLVPIENLLHSVHEEDPLELQADIPVVHVVTGDSDLGKPGAGQSVVTRLYTGRNAYCTDSFKECVKLPSVTPEASPKATWQVVLLQKTFVGQEPHTVDSAADALASVLDIDRGRAKSLAELAMLEVETQLEGCLSKHDASRKTQLLRDEGLIVRMRLARHSSKHRQFLSNHSTHSTHSNRSNHSSRSNHSNHSSHSPAASRGTTHQLFEEIKCVPEDAVEAFFNAEQEMKQQKVAAAEAASAEKNKKHNLLTRRRSFRTMVRIAVQATKSNGNRAESADENRDASQLTDAVGWETAIDSIVSKQHINSSWKEACRLMRTFIYGCVGDEGNKSKKEADRVFQEVIGTRKMVGILYEKWTKLDHDHSGRVDLIEFRDFAKQEMDARWASERGGASPKAAKRTDADDEQFVEKLCERVEKLLLDKKSSFAIEDMMRLIWPAARVSELKQMKQWCREKAMRESRSKIKPPPLLPKEELEGLRSVFMLFDSDGDGRVDFEELVREGVIYEDQRDQYTREWDHNGDGSLDLYEFCEMMCPAGYRAHARARVGSLADGRKVLYDVQLGKWRLEDAADELDPGWL